jgi:tRNA(Ile)-lysidine synthase TilS/MesJ
MPIKFNKNIHHLAAKIFSSQPEELFILCSMGVDSVAATHFLVEKYRYLTKNKKVKIYPIHFNHNLRPQNDQMELKFFKFCEDFKLPGYPIHLDCTNSSEKECRDKRIEYIIASRYMKMCITAHHLDDCVESYLQNVFRGKEGFIPIPFLTRLDMGSSFGSCSLYHPFLFTEKKDFVDYAKKHDLMKYVEEDETNKVVKGSRRNLIRNEILPILDREKMGLKKIVKKKMCERLMLEMLK